MSVVYSSNCGSVGIYLIENDSHSVSKALCVVLKGLYDNTNELLVFKSDTKTFCKIRRIENELEGEDMSNFTWEVIKETKSYDDLINQ